MKNYHKTIIHKNRQRKKRNLSTADISKRPNTASTSLSAVIYDQGGEKGVKRKEGGEVPL
jgi:hypothetical protein